MNFELKPLSLSAAAAEKADLLVILVPEGFKPGPDTLSTVLAQALKAEDFNTKAARLLSAYRLAGVGSARVVFAGVGDGSAKAVRQAVQAAVASVRAESVKRLTLVFAGAEVSAAAVRSAV